MLLLALLALALTAEPARLLLGSGAQAELSVAVPEGSRVVFSASVGTVGEPRRAGGLLRATYTPPPLNTPSIALLLAQVEDGDERTLSWLALPLDGVDTLELQASPGAQVRAEIAGKVFGPVAADPRGLARVPVVVPPGAREATFRVIDKQGRASAKPLDLVYPPFSRLRLAARAAAASVATPLEVEIFVVTREGLPDTRAAVELLASQGELIAAGSPAPGVTLMKYLPPQGETGDAHLEAKASGQLAALDVPVRPARVILAQPFWQSGLAAERPWSLSLGALAGAGATFDGAGTATLLGQAALRLEVLPLQALLEAGAGLFGEVRQSAGSAPAERARVRTWLVQTGVRANRQLLAGLDGHLALVFGFQHQSVSTTLASGQVLDLDGFTPRVALSAGGSLRLGPGRALLQVQVDSAGSGVGRLIGSTSAVQVVAGYAFVVR